MARSTRAVELPDIKPRTAVAALDREAWTDHPQRISVVEAAAVVGMSAVFIRKVLGAKTELYRQ